MGLSLITYRKHAINVELRMYALKLFGGQICRADRNLVIKVRTKNNPYNVHGSRGDLGYAQEKNLPDHNPHSEYVIVIFSAFCLVDMAAVGTFFTKACGKISKFRNMLNIHYPMVQKYYTGENHR